MAALMPDRLWLYFGSYRREGHRLWRPGMCAASADLHHLASFDKILAPQGSRAPYRACISRLGSVNRSALAFWDESDDTRPGSNSIVFAPSLEIAPNVLLAEGARIFPEIFGRLPRPVVLL